MANRLEAERSPFLQHGAHQPVDWWPWSDEAFEQARRGDKPVLLDIGAVWCHWCHVMDRESYEDPETAALINELFLPIKVDRDERPDVDTRYQRAIQTLTGQGGWPLTAFLTPDGETFYGGTYFPPDDAYGRPSFRRVLREVARIWRDERSRALEAARGLTERTTTYARAESQAGEPDAALVAEAIEEYAHSYDFRFAGFGRAPKFPNAGALLLLLDHDLEKNVGWSGRMVRETLTAMDRGGIHDQLGGGFHRYSVDARWIIPHFEKMAYDNGPLLEVYAKAAAAYDAEEYRNVVRGIVSYYEDVAGELLAGGGFPASQDADYSPDDDGDYWTWTEEEVRTTLNDRGLADVAVDFFGINDPASSMHLDPTRHVLFRRREAEGEERDRVARVVSLLKSARDQRPRPFVDTTVYTGWSALVATGFLAAARFCGHASAGETALRALERIWREAFDPERGLAHRLGDRTAGEHLDDHAHLAQALLDAFELTQAAEWLERAQRLVGVTSSLFKQPGEHGYRDRPLQARAPTASLAEPSYSIADAPVPSGNSVLALTLLRLSELTAEPAHRREALQILSAFGGAARRLSTAAPSYLRALEWTASTTTKIVIVGSGAPAENPLFGAALRAYRPRSTLRWLDANTIDQAELAPEIRAMLTGAAPCAYVCVGQTCFAPTGEAAELTTLLQSGKPPGSEGERNAES